MDVCLVGRNSQKLRAVADLLRKETSGRRLRIITVVADLVKDPIAREGKCYAGYITEGTHNYDHMRYDTPSDQGYKQILMPDVGGYRQRSADEDPDDVGDRCFCQVSEDHVPTGVSVDRRCGRWYPRLRAVVEGRLRDDGGVGVLINCAGVCYPHPEYFAAMSDDRGRSVGDVEPATFTSTFCGSADETIKCNVSAAVHACRLVLPTMMARGRGLIVNVGSASASVRPAMPLMALYVATKAFLEKLSADLDTECMYLNRKSDTVDTYGIRVQYVKPAYVATAMLQSTNPNIHVIPNDGDDSDEEYDVENYGDSSWWDVKRRMIVNRLERWLVPSTHRWVQSALRKGGQLYASGSDRPAKFTGYDPHTLLIWVTTMASTFTPRWWYLENVLISGMLRYRTKGRMAFVEKNKRINESN